MSFIRAATLARSVVSNLSDANVQFFILFLQATSSCRRYSTEAAPKKSSNLGLYLGGAGLVGLGAYVYTSFGSQDIKTAKKDLKSPLDPSKYIDLKLKRVEPYNHNTAK